MNQKGFTLVELAIVLVIIGVILGGVIKGQELVTNARLKQLYRNFQTVEFGFFAYQDRYNDLPGDDSRTPTGLGGDGASNAQGDSDGTIEGQWTSNTITNESVRFWGHLREAGYFNDANNETDIDAIPVNALGTRMGVEDTNYGITGPVVCFQGLDADDAEAFDAQFDDGVGTTGDIRANTTTNNAATGLAYDGTSTGNYHVCISLTN